MTAVPPAEGAGPRRFGVPTPWGRRLDGRAMLLMLAAVMAVHLGSILIHRDQAAEVAEALMDSQLAGRLAVVLRSLETSPPEARAANALSLSSPTLTLQLSAAPALARSDATAPPMLRRLHDMAPGLAGFDLRLGTRQGVSADQEVRGTAALAGGSFVNFTARQTPGPTDRHAALVSTSLMTAAVAVFAIVMMRRLTLPLSRLAGAADSIGRGPAVAVAEDGPDEVRQVAVAFNGMQARIERLIADRIQALAAVSHDLRTPLTRMRLRAGFLADPEAQRAMDADLDEMETMIEATLHYLRQGTEAEAPKRTDLAALLGTVVDDAVDAGQDASYAGPRHLAVSVKALSLKRAVANLVGNAVAYGVRARVSLVADAAAVTIIVEDDGPGIAAADRQRVFEPFERLDASRGSRTGGVGLGLAIVRQAVEQERGTIRLGDAAGGGLRVEIVLPVDRHAAA
ncbi:MAG: ATP-binding protein [Janthinobacterium lividum]